MTFDFYSGLLKHYISDENYIDILWMKDNLIDDAVILTTPEISTAIYPISYNYVADYAFSPNEDLNRLFRYPCSYKGVREQHRITHVYKPESLCPDIQLISNDVYVYTS